MKLAGTPEGMGEGWFLSVMQVTVTKTKRGEDGSILPSENAKQEGVAKGTNFCLLRAIRRTSKQGATWQGQCPSP